MSKKSKTSSTQNTNQTTTQNSTSTSTPTNPDWVTNSTQSLQSRINGLLDTDPQSLVAGASNLQQQAFDQSGNLGSTWQAGNTAAQSAATGLLGTTSTPTLATASLTGAPQQATAGSLLDVDLSGYMNPYDQTVTRQTLASNDDAAAQQRALLAAQQAAGGKFSGSGSAIQTAIANRTALQDRAALESGLRQAGYDKAVSSATNDLDRAASASQFNAGQANSMANENADRSTNNSQFNSTAANTAAQNDRSAQLQAAGLLGDLSNSADANNRGDIGLLSSEGDTQRGIASDQLGANTELLKLVAALNGSQPYSLYQGQTTSGSGTANTSGTTTGTSTTKTSDPLGTISSLVGGLGSLATGLGDMGVTMGSLSNLGKTFSDERLKEDVKTVGRDRRGRRVVHYRYKGEPDNIHRVGMIAQDVERTDPHAVTRGPGGYRMIDYGLLGAA